MIDYCSEAFVTKVDDVGGAEVFFPNLDEADNWSLEYESVPVTDNGYTVRFTTYKNNRVRNF